MRKIFSLVVIAVLSTSSSIAFAGDAAAGKSKAASCGACHGMNGVSTNDIWPNLAGQKAGYLMAQLKAFRDGQRKNPMMSPMAAPLSDTDIDNLAAYYSSLGQ
jgi:cytochrome c553